MMTSKHDVKKVKRVQELIAQGLSYREVGESVGLSKAAVAGIVYRYGKTEIIDLSDMTPENATEKIGEAIKQIEEKINEQRSN